MLVHQYRSQMVVLVRQHCITLCIITREDRKGQMLTLTECVSFPTVAICNVICNVMANVM